MTWHDVYVLARFAPPGSPLAAAVNPSATWRTEMYGLVEIIDSLWRIAWLQGGAQGPAPDPIPRPGRQPEKDITSAEDQDLDPVTMEELDEWYHRQFTVSSAVTEQEE